MSCPEKCEPCEPCKTSCRPCQPCEPCKTSCRPCQPCEPCKTSCRPCQPCEPCKTLCRPCQPCEPCKTPCRPCQPCQPCCLPCQPCCPTPLANSCNEPCVRQCQNSTVVIEPPAVVVTLPGPILSSFPQNTIVGSSTSAAIGSILSCNGVPINSGCCDLSCITSCYCGNRCQPC